MRYDNECSGCGKYLKEWSFATDRQGHLPTAFCGSVCESNYKQNKKMVDNKPLTATRKGLTTEQLTQKMSKVPFRVEFVDREHGIYGQAK